MRLRTTTSSTLSEKAKVLASQIRVERVRQHCGDTKTFHSALFTRTTDLLMLDSFNLRSYTRNVAPFPKEGFVVRTLQQKGPTLVAWLSRFK